jgi:response regulator RpfG family c-di-GMP phosphodiesterase
MTAKVLFVDDEPRVLDAIRRLLRGRIDGRFAASGQAALEALAAEGPFAVVVSDMRMPGMNGAELLEKIRDAAPDSVRMMLTGNADQATAAEAVNRGQVFRFLTKPCDPDLLTEALDGAIKHHRLLTAERDLLERTVRGAVQAMTTVLSIARPEAFGRVDRLLRIVRQTANAAGAPMDWALDTAVRLSPIGGVGVAPDLIERGARGAALSAAEQAEYTRQAAIGADVVAAIPRLEPVAAVLRAQFKHFDGSGPPTDGPRGKDIPLGARLLHAAAAYDALRSAGFAHAAAVTELRSRKGVFDPDLLAHLPADEIERGATVTRVDVDKIGVGMTIDEDVRADGGPLLLCRGQEVTPMLVERLRALRQAGAVPKTLLVRAPVRT